MNLPIDVDLSFWLDLGAHHPYIVMWRLILVGGWIPIVFAISKGLKDLWLYWKWIVWSGTLNWTYLAIDVPRENDQSLKAMEGFLAIVAGTRRSLTKWEQWYHGMYNLKTSLEIVSIDGYVQYLIRVEKRYRANLESAIYAYFPDAEITEVEDYTKGMPTEFPNDEGWQCWGTEYDMDRPSCYPLRTYVWFEHQFGERYFIDPIAPFLDMMTSLERGEQFWFQLVLSPVPDDFVKKGEEEVNRLIERDMPKDQDKTLGFVEKMFHPLFSVLREVLGQEIIPLASETKEEKKQWPTMMQHMTEGQKAGVQAIELKIAKVAFSVRLRAIYWGKKEVYNQQRFLSHFHGYLKQFQSLDLNGFSRNQRTKTGTDYFFVRLRNKARRRKLVKNYQSRENTAGANGFVLNVEELATLWHFPTADVRAPLVSQVASKRSEPPSTLPVEGGQSGLTRVHTPVQRAPAPVGLPSE